MQVHSWTIDGIAELPRIESGDLPNSLVVVYSADPDRKAAALATIRRVLFGGGEVAATGARCSALLSGPNGQFELTTNGAPGSESLRRVGGGAEAGYEDLALLFGDSRRDGLRQVFDLTSGADLAAIAAASPPSPDFLVAAGAMTSRMREILGDDGEGEIDRLLAELGQLEARLAASLAREAEYYQRLEDERRITAEIGQICADLAEMRRRRDRWRAYAAVWPVWQRRATAEHDLDAVEAIDHFPDGALGIVEAQIAAHDAEERVSELRRRQRQARAELEVIPPQGDRYRVVDQVDAICSELPAYRQQMIAFARARARRDDLQRQRRELRHVAAAGGVELAHSAPELDLLAVREWLARKADLDGHEGRARGDLEQVRTSLRQLRNERQRAVRAAKAIDVELDDSDEHWRALWSLRDDLEQLWEVQSQGEAAARSAEHRSERLTQLEQSQPQRRGSRLSAVLWTVACIAFAAGLWAAGREDSASALILCSLAIAAVLLDFTIGWLHGRAQGRVVAAGAKARQLRADIERVRQLRDARWRTADDLTRRVETAARALGLSPMPSFEEVEAAEMKLFSASRKLHDRGPLVETALAVHEYQEREEHLMAELREARHAREAAALEWEEWKSTVGLPAGLRQEDLATYLCECDRWREIDQEVDQIEAQLSELAPAIEKWEASARGLLAEVGVAVEAHLCGRELEDQLASLRDSAHRSLRLHERRADVGARLETIEAELAAAVPVAHTARAAFESLREAAGTDDAEEFERRRQMFHRRRELDAVLRERDDELIRQLEAHRMTDGPEVRADLAAGDAESWSEKARQADAEIARLEARMTKASHERSVAAADCQTIAATSDVAAIRQDRECLREEIHCLADEWRTLALAHGLLQEEAREATPPTDLLRNASASLCRLTGGELVQFKAHGDGERTVVLDRAGVQHEIDGTLSGPRAKLIDLSLKLGLVQEVSRNSGPVPVLLDDPLRDVDSPWNSAVAAEIVRLATEQQVFYFTCDELSLDQLRDAGTGARVLRI